MQGVSDVAEFVDPSLLPHGPVRVAAYDGENAEPAIGREMGDGVFARAPWGEIAYALAGRTGYERVRTRAHETETVTFSPCADFCSRMRKDVKALTS